MLRMRNLWSIFFSSGKVYNKTELPTRIQRKEMVTFYYVSEGYSDFPLWFGKNKVDWQ
ncbi:hypothetical protein GHT06_010584 [Daphnia sinensis]|uniref:Uncharacterized protein n=1 Tax=Daphnia sinensis TaxID=1820382 RepID=A0AAD5KZ42_9CRUS|nr:hypothetical protein GHT06_010584 [Daphnia sinensis]